MNLQDLAITLHLSIKHQVWFEATNFNTEIKVSAGWEFSVLKMYVSNTCNPR